jgi:hypothetical protein
MPDFFEAPFGKLPKLPPQEKGSGFKIAPAETGAGQHQLI